MVIPELPGYLRALGGEAYLGLIYSLFTFTAGISRPFSGKWADHIGRVPVMLTGALVSAFCGLLYPFVLGVFGFLALRFFHGFSTGFTPTGVTSYVADIIHPQKRGEAMGLIGLAGSLGMAAGPAAGSYFADSYGLNTMFYASSATGFVAYMLLFRAKETLANPKPFTISMFRIHKDEWIEKACLPPALVILLCTFSFGTMLTLVPDVSVYAGMKNKGLFFTIFTISSVAVRFSAGRISDRIGREKVLLLSTVLLATAMFVIGFSDTKAKLTIGAVLFGLAQGINSPTIFAWAIDLSNVKAVGKAMATVFMAMEAGIGLGALLSGSLYGGKTANFPILFGASALLCLAASIYLLWRLFKKGF